MSLLKYIERLQRMDSLISMKSTGTPKEFAEKLGIKRSTLFQTLQEMRELGVDIRYSPGRQSYYYADNKRLKIKSEIALQSNFSGGNQWSRVEEIELLLIQANIFK